MNDYDSLSCVYMLCSCNPDNKIRYIGSTNNIIKRMYMHTYRNIHGIYPHVYNALENSFYVKILEYLDPNMSKKEMKDRNKHLINQEMNGTIEIDLPYLNEDEKNMQKIKTRLIKDVGYYMH